MNENFNKLLDILHKADNLGQKTIDKTGAQLIGHVPHVAPEAWYHNIFKPLTEEEIKFLEDKIKINFPDTFKDFLKFSNGIKIFSNEISIHGKRDNYNREGDDVWQPFDILTINIDERPKDANSSYLFIGSYYDDGSQLYIDCDTEKVYRCEPGLSQKKLNMWGDIGTMIISEAQRIEKLYDEKGQLIDQSKPTTPEPDNNI